MGTVCIAIVIMLLLSAFFSGMETAFISSNKLRLEIDRKQSPVFSRIAGIFIHHSKQYITTILVGNNIALVVYSLFMSQLYFSLFGQGSILVETLIATVIIIFVAEFLPKAIVRRNPNFYFRTFAFPVFFFYVLLYPIAKLTTWLSIGLIRLFGHRQQSQPVVMFDRNDLAHLVEERGETEETEHEMKLFQNALDFPDLRVRDCMVPRVDIEAIDLHTPVETLTDRFIESQYSRIFVWEESIDNIIGYVNIKSLFRHPKSVAEILMKVDFVPETMPAQQLLTTFIKQRSSVAVVIDEFGGTAGIVSLEDILEEIFGEIEDEHDSQDEVEKVLSEGEYLFSARLEVKYLNEKYDLGIEESEDYDTLAGYIICHAEDIPSVGETIRIGRHEIRIMKTTSSRVELVRVKVSEG